MEKEMNANEGERVGDEQDGGERGTGLCLLIRVFVFLSRATGVTPPAG